MAADLLHDSSSHVYNSQWKPLPMPRNLSYITLAESLVHLYVENKQVDTIKIHRAAIASVPKMLNPPTVLQEDTIHNIIRRMSILRPRTQEVLPRWHLSVVLEGLMIPPFVINGSDRNISLELLSYKTAFLIALATGTRGSELVALSRAPQFPRIQDFGFRSSTSLYSDGTQVHPEESTSWTYYQTSGVSRNCPFIPKGPGKTSLSRTALGLYMVKSTERTKEDPQQKLFALSLLIYSSSLLTSDDGKPRPFDLPMKIHRRLIFQRSGLTMCYIYRLEIFQRVCPALSERYGSWCRATGPSYGGGTHGPPLKMCPSTPRSPPPPTWVTFRINGLWEHSMV